MDAEEPAGQCVIFPVYYIRLFFQKERSKKQKRLLDLTKTNLRESNLTQQLLITDEKNPITIIPMNKVGNSTSGNHITANQRDDFIPEDNEEEDEENEKGNNRTATDQEISK